MPYAYLVKTHSYRRLRFAASDFVRDGQRGIDALLPTRPTSIEGFVIPAQLAGRRRERHLIHSNVGVISLEVTATIPKC